jgi:hypothetical protein
VFKSDKIKMTATGQAFRGLDSQLFTIFRYANETQDAYITVNNTG